jgi:hypothetical protein
MVEEDPAEEDPFNPADSAQFQNGGGTPASTRSNAA